MAKTLAQLKKQIAALQRQAEEIERREVGEVVARIKEAIAHYGLTVEHLFGSAPAKKTVKGRRADGANASTKKVRAARKSSLVKPKFRDEHGNTWSGRGRQPRWLTAAVAEGKSIEDFRINGEG